MSVDSGLSCKKFKRNGFIALFTVIVIFVFLDYLTEDPSYGVTIFYILALLLFLFILGRSRCGKIKKKP